MSIHVLQQSRPAHRLHLTEARVLHQWSQVDMAEQLGTTQVNVSRWERGITRPSPYFRRRLCELFGKQLWELDLDASCEPVNETRMPIIDPALPALPVPFVGRTNELAQLKAGLQARPGPAPLVLYGLPGVGKSALALTLAHDPEVRASFPDGILWVRSGATSEIAHHLTRWGRVLGLHIAENTHAGRIERWTQLRLALASRAMLLIIDDAWHAEEAAMFLVGGAHCAHLVTTRLPVLASQLTTQEGIRLEELNVQESMTLLAQLAPRAIKHEEPRIKDLVSRTGGIPLALRLIGRYLNTQSYNDQPRRIRTALDRLQDGEERMRLSTTPLDTMPSLHTVMQPTVSLSATIALSDQQLPNEAREALYALSVFSATSQDFSQAAALAVTGAAPDLLSTLTDAGLLEATVPGRYRLHQTIAEYARLHVHDREVWQRLISYGVNIVQEHTNDYQTLDSECSTIQTALQAAHQEGYDQELVQGVCAFLPYLLQRENHQVAQQLVEQAYTVACKMLEKEGLIRLLGYRGELALKRGETACALTAFQEALELITPELREHPACR